MFAYNIALIGFMGSGKSTVAKYLKETQGMDIVEMDVLIEEREGMNIPDIFSNCGEEYFRSLETNLLKDLGSSQNIVISCGGGAALRQENVDYLRKSSKIVFLNASPQSIYERVKNDSQRPLLQGKNHVEGIAELMNARQDKYLSAADLIISTDNRTVEAIGEEIVQKLKEMEER